MSNAMSGQSLRTSPDAFDVAEVFGPARGALVADEVVAPDEVDFQDGLHDSRRISAGAIPSARLVGNPAAHAATITRTSAAPPTTSGSPGLTP